MPTTAVHLFMGTAKRAVPAAPRALIIRLLVPISVGQLRAKNIN